MLNRLSASAPRPILLLAVAGFFAVVGASHFTHTDTLVRIVPPVVPFKPWVVMLTGLCELIGAVGLLLPATRRAAAWALIAYCVAVFPCHIYMLMTAEQFPHVPLWALWLRLPLQGVFIWLIWLAALRQPAVRAARAP